MQDEGNKGGETDKEKRQMQVRGAGCRDERKRMEGVKSGQRLGGRCSAPVEEVGSG